MGDFSISSLGRLEMTTGQIITNNDSYSGTVSADNIVRELLPMGKTWKSYAESLPYYRVSWSSVQCQPAWESKKEIPA
jgi:hypothetical protein